MAPEDNPQATDADATAQEPQPLFVASSPHIRSPESIRRIMWTVSATLLPAVGWGVYVFGPRVLWLLVLGVGSAAAMEAVCQALRRKPITVGDGSAVLTGLLVVLIFPVHVPWYVPVTGSVFAIGVAKQAFGGLGCNIWNPALAGRAFVLACWTALVTVGAGWPVPFHYRQAPPGAGGAAAQVDAVTAPTPLTKVKRRIRGFSSGQRGGVAAPNSRLGAADTLETLRGEQGVRTELRDLILGRVGGCVGEVSAVALALGGLALIALGYVKWQVPVLYIATVALLSWVLPFPIHQTEDVRFLVWGAGQPLFEIFAGGLFLGAFFMATDMVTSPVTRKGLAIFAIGCGLLTVVIRRYGGYPEGVCYAILVMNTATPLIDRYTKSKVFGRRRKRDE